MSSFLSLERRKDVIAFYFFTATIQAQNSKQKEVSQGKCEKEKKNKVRVPLLEIIML